MRRLLAVAVTSLAVVALGPSADRASTWVAVVAVVVAVALSVLERHHESLPLAAAALALAVAASADLGGGGEVLRWAALAALPLVVPLAGLSLVRPSRAATVVLLAALTVAGPVRALAYDPLQDPACRACLPLPAVLGHRPDASWWVLVGGVVALAPLATQRPPRRRLLLLVALLVAGAWALTGWREPRGAVVPACQLALLVAGLAGASSVVESLTNRARIARLEAMVRDGGGPEVALRASLGDPGATLAFAADGGWVGPEGGVVEGPAPNQVGTPVRIGGRVAARIHHAPDDGRARLVADTLTPELRIGIEQARLDALLRAHVRELRESRLRLVEASDRQRRRVEQDLHDGAQQHLLSLGLEIRRALAVSPADATLGRCMTATTAAMDDLRTLAHGVYPAVLTGAGLAPALEHLGAQVTVGAVPAERFAPAVERTLYLVVSELVGAGSPLEVRADLHGDDLVMTVTGGCLGPGSVAGERVEALGGGVRVGGNHTEVRIPCA